MSGAANNLNQRLNGARQRANPYIAPRNQQQQQRPLPRRPAPRPQRPGQARVRPAVNRPNIANARNVRNRPAAGIGNPPPLVNVQNQQPANAARAQVPANPAPAPRANAIPAPAPVRQQQQQQGNQARPNVVPVHAPQQQANPGQAGNVQANVAPANVVPPPAPAAQAIAQQANLGNQANVVPPAAPAMPPAAPAGQAQQHPPPVPANQVPPAAPVHQAPPAAPVHQAPPAAPVYQAPPPGAAPQVVGIQQQQQQQNIPLPQPVAQFQNQAVAPANQLDNLLNAVTNLQGQLPIDNTASQQRSMPFGSGFNFRNSRISLRSQHHSIGNGLSINSRSNRAVNPLSNTNRSRLQQQFQLRKIKNLQQQVSNLRGGMGSQEEKDLLDQIQASVDTMEQNVSYSTPFDAFEYTGSGYGRERGGFHRGYSNNTRMYILLNYVLSS